MSGRAVAVAVALVVGVLWAPAGGWAQEPEGGSQAAPACEQTDEGCGASPEPAAVGVVPSRPADLASGHEDQSIPILVGLSVVAFGGLVIAVLHRLSLEDE